VTVDCLHQSGTYLFTPKMVEILLPRQRLVSRFFI
jgi:hypothetical protein